MTAEEILKKSPTANTEEPVYVNVGQWWASAEVDADVGFWADAPVGSLYHQNIPFGGTTSYVKVADNRVPSDWVRIQEQVPPDALTGLAAFIAGETVQRDEEAAAVTRAKVRQLIDDVKREKGIPDTAYDIVRTHWADCWRDRSHHNCAVAEIERLRNQLDELGMLRMYKQDADAKIARLRYEYARLYRQDATSEAVRVVSEENERVRAVLATIAEYIDNGVRPPAHVDIDGLYARMRDAVNGWRGGGQP